MIAVVSFKYKRWRKFGFDSIELIKVFSPIDVDEEGIDVGTSSFVLLFAFSKPLTVKYES